jgi:hypothetical protein
MPEPKPIGTFGDVNLEILPMSVFFLSLLLLPAVSSQILSKVKSKLSQEVVAEMAPCSWAKLVLLSRHDKAHMVVIPANVTPHSKMKHILKMKKVHFEHLCPDQYRISFQICECGILNLESEHALHVPG